MLTGACDPMLCPSPRLPVSPSTRLPYPGVAGNTTTGTATALTDHNIVTAQFTLPEVPHSPMLTMPLFARQRFAAVTSRWASAGVMDGTCGQYQTPCVMYGQRRHYHVRPFLARFPGGPPHTRRAPCSTSYHSKHP